MFALCGNRTRDLLRSRRAFPLAMNNTADVTSAKSIAVFLQSISGVSAINSLVAFYDIHGRKKEVLFFYFVPDTTRDRTLHTFNNVFLAQNKKFYVLLENPKMKSNTSKAVTKLLNMQKVFIC
jgi:hypothetical protein